jgi:adenosylmethionine---8-amino-7-oxononanoate aminotransferase
MKAEKTAPDWVARDAELCWHPYTQHGIEAEPLAVVGAQGSWLELASGRRLIDAISSWWTCLHGHGRPELVGALAEQAARLDHVLFAGCTHEGAVKLAEGLVRVARESLGPGLSRVFYSDDGSTAVEVALKLAYQCWVRRGEPRRTVFIALEGAYHGDTFGAMALGEPEPFFAEFSPFLFEVVRVPPCDQALAEAIEAHAGRVAALIVEPLVQGAAGMVMYDPGFLVAARRLLDAEGAFLIADEVMTGFGRTGTLFACEQAGVRPDLMSLAKGLTAGMLPLSVTLATEDIYQSFVSDARAKAFFHGHSFTANPLGCAVGVASLELLERERTPARLAAIGARIEASLRAGIGGLSGVKELRRRGGIVALELESEGGYLASLGERLRAACRRQDVLLRPLGSVLYALPPSSTSESECDLIAAAMIAVCQEALEE